MKSKNIKVYTKQKEIEKNRYDIITLFHVLEHILDIECFFKTLDSIVDKKTILLFQIPQAESLDIQLLSSFHTDFVLHTPYHINLFSERSLRILFEKYGYVVDEVDYEFYQTHSLVMNQNLYIKLLATPFMFLINAVNTLTKKSPYITAYVHKQ